MCYSLGYTLSQPVTGLFVVSEGNFPLLHHAVLNESTDIVNLTHIYIPYGVFGAYQVILSLPFLAFFIMGLTYTSVHIRSSKSIREMLNLSSWTGGREWYGIYMLVSLFALYVGIVFREVMIGMYLCTAGTFLFKMSGFKASLLGMAYNISLLIGRVLGMVCALCVRIQTMVLVELITVFVIMVIISIVGFKVEMCFWFLVCILGVFMGPNYPSVMAWADRYIEATGFVVAIIDTGIGAGAFIAFLGGGLVLQRLDAQWLFYLCSVSTAFVLALFLPMQVVSSKRGDRHEQKGL